MFTFRVGVSSRTCGLRISTQLVSLAPSTCCASRRRLRRRARGRLRTPDVPPKLYARLPLAACSAALQCTALDWIIGHCLFALRAAFVDWRANSLVNVTYRRHRDHFAVNTTTTTSSTQVATRERATGGRHVTSGAGSSADNETSGRTALGRFRFEYINRPTDDSSWPRSLLWSACHHHHHRP